jgi:hypothetical protein
MVAATISALARSSVRVFAFAPILLALTFSTATKFDAGAAACCDTATSSVMVVGKSSMSILCQRKDDVKGGGRRKERKKREKKEEKEGGEESDTITGTSFEGSHEFTKGVSSVLAILEDVQHERVLRINSLCVE